MSPHQPSITGRIVNQNYSFEKIFCHSLKLSERSPFPFQNILNVGKLITNVAQKGSIYLVKWFVSVIRWLMSANPNCAIKTRL